ncbi:hypothetical protein HY642_04675 [Candidatus Woesearchaeota archaeon]|nr:hypothetical protein [Candidatus Woesearchaeota archaeon]
MGDEFAKILLPATDAALLGFKRHVIGALSSGRGEVLEIRVQAPVQGKREAVPGVYETLCQLAAKYKVNLWQATWFQNYSSLMAVYGTLSPDARRAFIDSLRADMHSHEAEIGFAYATESGVARDGFSDKYMTLQHWLDAAEEDRTEGRNT